MRTEPSGPVITFPVYAGVNDDDLGGVGHTVNVVMYLMQDRLDLGHRLFTDNFLTVLVFTGTSRSLNLHTGTLREGTKAILVVL